MSHVTPIQCEVRDLDALERAVRRFDGVLVRDHQTFRFYGGATEQCAHAIRFPGCAYEVGVKQTGEAGVFSLAWDSYEPRLASLLGGEGAPLLVRAYGLEKARAEMVADGWTVSEVEHADGDIELVGTEW